jgi:hypothetical protein
MLTGLILDIAIYWFGFMSAIVGFPSGYLENEKKSGVLSLLFEYSSQGSCPSICLEALQVILSQHIFGIGCQV